MLVPSYRCPGFGPSMKNIIADPMSVQVTTKYNPDAFESDGGPLEVSYANTANPFSSFLEGSLNEIGVATTEDFNSGSLMGGQYCSSTIDPATELRSSAQASFLDDASSRSNLDLYETTMAKKILFNGNKTAVGVEVQSLQTLGLSYNITARKEVIVSSGTFQSPQLLMVSGVGPAAALEELGIDVISDLTGMYIKGS
jgi:choline dehydrogenase